MPRAVGRQKALAEVQAIAGEVVEADKRDQQRTAEVMALAEANGAIAKARKRREPAAVRRALESWITHGEAELALGENDRGDKGEAGGQEYRHLAAGHQLE